ncbi:MAG: hypothetical protein BroJett018_34010 [Chloroflexota bacterium]|nr:MAG: hypothetical protein BroJett018_34010 [Chloroflexota bacterium]
MVRAIMAITGTGTMVRAIKATTATMGITVRVTTKTIDGCPALLRETKRTASWPSFLLWKGGGTNKMQTPY